MSKRNELVREINGRMTVSWSEGSDLVTQVYAGPAVEGEPLAEWVFPSAMFVDFNAAARQAEAQTSGYVGPPELAGVIATAVRDFDFSNYGMDDVDEIKDETWVLHLAEGIVQAVRLYDQKRGRV